MRRSETTTTKHTTTVTVKTVKEDTVNGGARTETTTRVVDTDHPMGRNQPCAVAFGILFRTARYGFLTPNIRACPENKYNRFGRSFSFPLASNLGLAGKPVEVRPRRGITFSRGPEITKGSGNSQ